MRENKEKHIWKKEWKMKIPCGYWNRLCWEGVFSEVQYTAAPRTGMTPIY